MTSPGSLGVQSNLRLRLSSRARASPKQRNQRRGALGGDPVDLIDHGAELLRTGPVQGTLLFRSRVHTSRIEPAVSVAEAPRIRTALHARDVNMFDTMRGQAVPKGPGVAQATWGNHERNELIQKCRCGRDRERRYVLVRAQRMIRVEPRDI